MTRDGYQGTGGPAPKNPPSGGSSGKRPKRGRPNDIPQDIWDAAELEVRRWPLNTDCVPEVARIIMVERGRPALSVAALRLHVAYEALPADRGGKNGPKGKAWAAFIAARDTALASAS